MRQISGPPQRCQSQFVWSRRHLLQRTNNVKVARRRLDRFFAPDVLMTKRCLNPMLQNDNKVSSPKALPTEMPLNSDRNAPAAAA